MEVPADEGSSAYQSGWPRGALTSPGQDPELRALRSRWRTASLASGWRFPSDWTLPEVDSVCAVVLRGGDPEQALAGLARARAAAGAGLLEVLADLAALHAVLSDPNAHDGLVSPDIDATPSRMLRVTALAWADVAMDQLANIEVVDPLTGLPTVAYLRTRLGELYRHLGRDVNEQYTLLVVGLDLSEVSGWRRATGMILLAEGLRTVLDGGESMATLGPSTIAAVLPRDGHISTKAVDLRRALHERLSVDEQFDEMGTPRIRLVRLPGSHGAACALLRRLSRS
ncbi:GGDEF domain-containing protein [Amycolatopsis sp.]|uniref:GGDEF domain-containing protein n=1 Tax=Amycolatopsis sp. TaxID=37632 RepID=UPI0039C8A007